MLHVEVARNPRSKLKREDVKQLVRDALSRYKNPTEDFCLDDKKNAYLKDHVTSINFCSLDKLDYKLQLSDPVKKCNGYPSSVSSPYNTLEIHVFELNEDGENSEFIDIDEKAVVSPASHHWILPSRDFVDLWDSLIFDSDVKARLLDYIETTILFSERKVNDCLISWKKVILLHGPPGTGKTSLCKALAQKATIRLGSRYVAGRLIEIYSYKLFSEDGKLDKKLLTQIKNIVKNSETIVFLLIDPVEDLIQCRAVNALLTQINYITKYPNVQVLMTSTLEERSIDSVFGNLAIFKVNIALPSTKVVYEIFLSCINELMSKDLIVKSEDLLSSTNGASNAATKKLMDISTSCLNFSPRTLRKIPILTDARFCRYGSWPLNDYIIAMQTAIEREKCDMKNIKTPYSDRPSSQCSSKNIDQMSSSSDQIGPSPKEDPDEPDVIVLETIRKPRGRPIVRTEDVKRKASCSISSKASSTDEQCAFKNRTRNSSRQQSLIADVMVTNVTPSPAKKSKMVNPAHSIKTVYSLKSCFVDLSNCIIQSHLKPSTSPFKAPKIELDPSPSSSKIAADSRCKLKIEKKPSAPVTPIPTPIPSPTKNLQKPAVATIDPPLLSSPIWKAKPNVILPSTVSLKVQITKNESSDLKGARPQVTTVRPPKLSTSVVSGIYIPTSIQKDHFKNEKAIFSNDQKNVKLSSPVLKSSKEEAPPKYKTLDQEFKAKVPPQSATATIKPVASVGSKTANDRADTKIKEGTESPVMLVESKSKIKVCPDNKPALTLLPKLGKGSVARVWMCEKCGISFNLKKELTNHSRTHQDPITHSCGKCDRTFSRQVYAKRHEQGCTGRRRPSHSITPTSQVIEDPSDSVPETILPQVRVKTPLSQVSMGTPFSQASTEFSSSVSSLSSPSDCPMADPPTVDIDDPVLPQENLTEFELSGNVQQNTMDNPPLETMDFPLLGQTFSSCNICGMCFQFRDEVTQHYQIFHAGGTQQQFSASVTETGLGACLSFEEITQQQQQQQQQPMFYYDGSNNQFSAFHSEQVLSQPGFSNASNIGCTMSNIIDNGVPHAETIIEIETNQDFSSFLDSL